MTKIYVDATPKCIALVKEGLSMTVDIDEVVTSNQAEYLAVISALEYALKAKIPNPEILSDSELTVRQLTGLYQIKDRTLAALASKAWLLLDQTGGSISWVPGKDNPADAVSRGKTSIHPAGAERLLKAIMEKEPKIKEE